MKLLLLLLLSFSCRTIYSRLIEKITDRTLTTETKTTGSSPPVRLTRDAFEEDSETGSSKEDHVSSDEQVRPSDGKKPTRAFSRIKLRKNEPSSKIRLPRESHEKVDKPKKNITVTLQRNEAPTKQKTTLVKKPIPKYNEMDYDDDFQMKISRSPVRTVDSGEHEDEDFNLDDYDFDINHDEFIGRGKPLEPRLKNKVNQEHSRPAAKQEATRPDTKVQSKAPAVSRRPVSNKREERRAVQNPPKKAGDKEDYYDDTTTTQRTPGKEKARDSDDEFNDENEETDEFESKGASVRTIRSPWKMNAYVDKFSDKSSSVMSKVLSILPMFPEVPKKNENKQSYPSMNPWRARS